MNLTRKSKLFVKPIPPRGSYIMLGIACIVATLTLCPACVIIWGFIFGG